jgi:hypothetical protein
MNPAAKLSPSLLVAATLALACRGDQPPAPDRDRGGPVAAAAAAAPAGAPRIAAEEPVHDFGAITATDSVEHVFKIRNAGDADLKIDRVERT